MLSRSSAPAKSFLFACALAAFAVLVSVGTTYGARDVRESGTSQVQIDLDRPARLLLTITTKGCDSRRLLVRVDGKLEARRTIRKPREQVRTGELPARRVTVVASTPGCGATPKFSYSELSAAPGEDGKVEPYAPSDPGSPTLPSPGPTAVPDPGAAAVPPVEPPSSPLPAPAPPAPTPAGHIPVGTAVAARFLRGDPRYAQTVVDNFQSVTPEVEMKWEYTEPSQGVFDFRAAEEVVGFAENHGLSVRGHTLVWEQELPGWLTSGTWSRPELEAILRRHIQTEVARFAGRVGEWDVVNEPFENDGSLKSDVFSEVIGPGYIALALRWAHEADPSASLYINDYNVDWDGPKQDALVDLLRRLKAEGAPVDGIGMEEHLSLEWAPTEAQIEESMQRFEALGLDVEVTEMDVGTRKFAGTAEEAEDVQAEVFAAAARACRARERCLRFSVWGVSDAVSWLGVEEAGLPFDDDYRAKPAWLAIQRNLANP